jgi:hypothetical protein
MASRPNEAIETDAREAWLAAARARNEIQNRIVLAFRKQIQGTGRGPAESDLMLFAKAAAAERRLQCRLAHPTSPGGGGPDQKGTQLPRALGETTS